MTRDKKYPGLINQKNSLESYPTFVNDSIKAQPMNALSQDTLQQRPMVDLRNFIQKIRIGFEGRARAVSYGWDTADEYSLAFADVWYERFRKLETDMDLDIEARAKHYIINGYLNDLRGIGWLLAAQLTSQINIKRTKSSSQMNRMWGMATDDKGRAEAKRRGKRLGYPPKNKGTMFIIADSLIKANSPYTWVFLKARDKYNRHRDWTKRHVWLASRRIMMQVFLQHLWVVWRDLEGLPINKPYIMWKKGDAFQGGYYIPEAFGWRVPHIMAQFEDVPHAYFEWEPTWAFDPGLYEIPDEKS